MCVLAALGSTIVSAAAAQAYIYWGQEAPYKSGIGRAALDGTGATNNFVPSGGGNYAFTRGVAANGTDVFWGNNNPGSTTGFAPPVIGRLHLADSTVNQAFTGATGQSITGLTVAGGYIYWTSNNQDTSEVGRTPIVGGQQFQSITSVFGQANPHTCGVAVDDKYVYWANRTTNGIGRAELANFSTSSQVVEGDWLPLPDPSGVVSNPCGVAVDDTYVYWGINAFASGGVYEQAGTSIGRAKKSDKSGATNSFLGGGNRVTGLTIAGDFLYWSNAADYIEGHGSIGRGSVSGSGWQGDFVSGLNDPFGVAVDSAGPAAPPPVVLSPGAGNYIPPLSVSCGNCGSNRPPGPPPPRPDFSKVWTNYAVFVPATWSTPLVVGKSSPRLLATGSALHAGTTFNYILNRAAKVTVVIKHKGGKTVATLTRTGKKGRNALPFSGRIAGKALTPGPYQAVFTAKSGKKKSKPITIDFTIAAG